MEMEGMSDAQKAATFISDMDTALIHGLTLSQLIHDEQLRLYDLEADKRRSTEFMNEREAHFYALVCSETKGDKPAFGNDGARKAETALRVNTDTAYRTTQAELNTKSKDIATLKTRIDMLSSQLSLIKAYMHGGGSQRDYEVSGQ